jgi:hypothetical protein
MRWPLLALLLIVANACVRTAERTASSSRQTVAQRGSTIREPALDAGTAASSAENRQVRLEPTSSSEARSWLANSGACLEPLEPVYRLSDRWTGVRRALDLDDDALLVLVTAPAFQQPHALSLQRRPAGVYVLKVTRLSPSEPGTRTRERTIDLKTAKLLLRLWAALSSRVHLVESEEASLDGKAYYFSTSSVAGYTANPRRGSVLDRTIFAMDWLTDLVEEPAGEKPSDRNFIHEELREALARTIAKEPCVRRIVE